MKIEQTRDGWKVLEDEGAIQSLWHPRRVLTGGAYDLITAAVLSLRVRSPLVCMLGVAGGTVFRQLRELEPEAELVGVEPASANVPKGVPFDRLLSEYQAPSPEDPYTITIDDAFQGGCKVDIDPTPMLGDCQFYATHLHDDARCLPMAERFVRLFPSTAVVEGRALGFVLMGTMEPEYAFAGKPERRFASDEDQSIWDAIRVT